MDLLHTILNGFAPGGQQGVDKRAADIDEEKQLTRQRAEKADHDAFQFAMEQGHLPVHAGLVNRPAYDSGINFGRTAGGDIPAGGAVAETAIPPSGGFYTDHADPDRVYTHVDANGDKVQFERPTKDQQLLRQANMALAQALNPAARQAQQVADQREAASAQAKAQGTAAGTETGRQNSLNAARQQYGIALPAGSGVGENQKYLPEELPGVTQGISTATDLPAKIQQAQLARASQSLGSVTTPGAYKILYGQLSPELQQRFDSPEEFDPIKSPTRARMVTMSPDDQQKTSLMMNMKPEDWNSGIDNVAPPTGDTAALNKRTKMLVQSAVRRGDWAKADAAIKDAADQLGRTETGVRTAKATAPIKITVAGAEAAARGAGQMSASGATEDDFKRAGEQYAISGIMPPMGMGSAARGKIMHYAQQFARESGMSPRDMAVAQTAFAGDAKSLKAFQSQRDQIVSFENTAQKNLDLFLDAASKIPDVGSPWINKPLRTLDAKAIGDADMSAVNAARQVANNEIAKVTAGGGLSGVLSDSARNEVKDYNPADATFAQTVAVAKILKRDMANRHASMDAMIGEIKGRIGGGGNSGGGPPAGGAGSYKFLKQNANGHTIGSNGGPWVDVITGQPVQ